MAGENKFLSAPCCDSKPCRAQNAIQRQEAVVEGGRVALPRKLTGSTGGPVDRRLRLGEAAQKSFVCPARGPRSASPGQTVFELCDQ